MSEGNGWLRVSRAKPCPICGKPDWCLVAADGTAAICARIESAKRAGDKGAGWLHKLRDDYTCSMHRAIRRAIVHTTRKAVTESLSRLAGQWADAVDADALQHLANGLGVTAASLQRLRIGWAAEHRAWAFPMTNAAGDVLGIRLRAGDGRKWAVKGGHEGLFVPADLPASGELLICEGPTDAAALLDLGFAAIGRPSCRGGVRLVCRLAAGRDAVIVADGDGPGQRGALTLASTLRVYCPTVRIITPPDGTKDARAWRQAGATHQDIEAAIARATVIRLCIQTKRAQGCAKAGV